MGFSSLGVSKDYRNPAYIYCIILVSKQLPNEDYFDLSLALFSIKVTFLFIIY